MIIYDNSLNFHGDGERPDFTSSATSLRVRDKDLCHRISYFTIERGICNALNWLLCSDRENGRFEWGMGHIAGMILSVYGECGDFSGIDKEDKAEQLKQIVGRFIVGKDEVSLAFQKLRKIMGQKSMSEIQVAKAANKLLYELNSCPNNLRPGDSSWNRSVKCAYDPSDWYYDAQKNVFELSEEDSIRLTNLLHFTMGEVKGVSNSENAVFFYTACGQNKEPLLYSSKNSDMLSDKYSESRIPIEYQDYVENCRMLMNTCQLK